MFFLILQNQTSCNQHFFLARPFLFTHVWSLCINMSDTRVDPSKLTISSDRVVCQNHHRREMCFLRHDRECNLCSAERNDMHWCSFRPSLSVNWWHAAVSDGVLSSCGCLSACADGDFPLKFSWPFCDISGGFANLLLLEK